MHMQFLNYMTHVKKCIKENLLLPLQVPLKYKKLRSETAYFISRSHRINNVFDIAKVIKCKMINYAI